MGRKIKDLTGKTFGRLTVLHRGPDHIQQSGETRITWVCQCSCGNPELQILQRGSVEREDASCGCRRKEKMSAVTTTHGQSKTRTYKAYHNMLQRCYQESHPEYPNYGGRGIEVCARWREDYVHFVADMGACPPGLSIDRKDNDKGYCKDNCRWTTVKEQNRNKRDNRYVYAKGRRWVLADLAVELEMSVSTLRRRVERGLSEEQLVAPPAENKKRRLSPEKIEAIKEDLKTMAPRRVAEKHNVSYMHVNRIVRGLTHPDEDK